MTAHTDQIIADFVERLGLVTQADGLPRIAGRIMGLMIMHGGPFSFADLAERLLVSRASISTNTRLLENLGVIERTCVPGERQDYFRMRSKPYALLMRGYVERMRRAREMVEGTQSDLPSDLEDAHERLMELNEFYETLIESFESVIDSWDTKSKTSSAERPREPVEQTV